MRQTSPAPFFTPSIFLFPARVCDVDGAACCVGADDVAAAGCTPGTNVEFSDGNLALDCFLLSCRFLFYLLCEFL